MVRLEIGQNGLFITVIESVHGRYNMTDPTIWLILAIQLTTLTINLLLFRKIAQMIVISANKLSQDTALALQATVQQIVEGDFELPDLQPPNVFQQMIVEYFQSKINNPTIDAKIIQSRDNEGKFAKVIEDTSS